MSTETTAPTTTVNTPTDPINTDPMTALAATEPPQDTTTAPTPPAPTADTAFDVSSLFEPGLKKGTHRVLARILAYEPYRTMEGAVVGHQFKIATRAPLPDSNGGQIEPGKVFSYLNIYTTAGQFGTPADAHKKWMRLVLALNNVPVVTKDKASIAQAATAASQLPAERLLPGPTDENQAYYDQWKDTDVVAVLKADEKDGETKVKLVAVEAASTATQ